MRQMSEQGVRTLGELTEAIETTLGRTADGEERTVVDALDGIASAIRQLARPLEAMIESDNGI